MPPSDINFLYTKIWSIAAFAGNMFRVFCISDVAVIVSNCFLYAFTSTPGQLTMGIDFSSCSKLKAL
jgi:hypothetical protein